MENNTTNKIYVKPVKGKTNIMNIIIDEIAIDLIPMQEGGSNGGAKGFILDLIKTLAMENVNVIFHCYCYLFMQRELKEHLNTNNLRIHVVSRISKYFWNPYNSRILFCPFGSSSIPRKGLAVLSILYDLQVISYPQFFSRRDRKNRIKQIQRISKEATRIITISDFTRKEAIMYGFRREKVYTIPININYNEENGKGNRLIKETKNKNIILYPANLWEHKNHELLFTAFAMAIHKGLSPDISLICTGFGEKKRVNYLNSIINGMKLEGRIILTGYIGHMVLKQLYINSICMIFPSLYEGFGIPVIEAMSIGVPVCCSNTTALKEVSSDAALSFDPRNPSTMADSICKITSDSNLRARCRDKGYSQASMYSRRGGMIQEYSKAINETYLKSIKR